MQTIENGVTYGAPMVTTKLPNACTAVALQTALGDKDYFALAARWLHNSDGIAMWELPHAFGIGIAHIGDNLRSCVRSLKKAAYFAHSGALLFAVNVGAHFVLYAVTAQFDPQTLAFNALENHVTVTKGVPDLKTRIYLIMCPQTRAPMRMSEARFKELQKHV